VTIKEIVRRTGYSRALAHKVLRGQRSDVFRVRESSLEAHLPWLDAQRAIGCRNAAELWRQLKQSGLRECLRVVAEWAARRRRADKTDIGAISRAPSARTIARLMTIGRDRLQNPRRSSSPRSSAVCPPSYTDPPSTQMEQAAPHPMGQRIEPSMERKNTTSSGH
jgi:hypothetical protein